MSTWDDRSGWNTDWSAGPWRATWGSGCDASGSWEQSGPKWAPEEEAELHRQPWNGDRRREPGNGNRPKANDPAGWQHGDNKPTISEHEQMLNYGPKPANKQLSLKFKSYTQREGNKMEIEDVRSGLITTAEREKAAKDAAAALHSAELEHQAEAMEKVFAKKMENVEIRTVEVVVEKEIYRDRDVYIEVDVLPDGADRPPPLYIGGQSVHQWWAHWMAGAHVVPPEVKGKNGRPAWYNASVYSWEQFCLQACRDAGVPGVAICGE